ncbi:ABC transporter permease [Austwickia chelonae]|uniref:ABC transporter permease n=1 Tax=Austwickia chelonae TaxID=100225 RepID=UPI000E241932|nr:ABC transporter permease [Austwickia chelonae]
MPLLPTDALIHLEDGPDYLRLLLAVFVLAAFSGALRFFCGLGNGREEILAAGRATVQLGAVGIVVAGVLGSWPLTCLFIIIMVTVGAFTAGRRLRVSSWWPALLPVACGGLPVTAFLLAVGLLPMQTISIIPTAGILIGNAMTAVTLSGQRTLDALEERRGQVEAALALGFLPREAALLVARRTARLALVPALDQTRTVGLVTLPGAFVGTLLGGASPQQAAALQLVVLAGILASQSVAVFLTVELVSRGVMTRSKSTHQASLGPQSFLRLAGTPSTGDRRADSR